MRGNIGKSDKPRISLTDAESLIFSITQNVTGQFYGPIDSDLGLGIGILYENVYVPVFDPVRRIFVTVEESVLVITHECDIDQDNRRIYNTDVLVLPLIEFSALFNALCDEKNDDDVKSYLTDLANDKISQLMYLPPFVPKFPHGAVLYLNRMSYTHVSEFSNTFALGALTARGLQRLRFKLTNHFLREKFDRLPLSGPT